MILIVLRVIWFQTLVMGTMDNIAFWNIRGLNGPNKQMAVKSFLRTNKCAVLGLVETKTTLARTIEIQQEISPTWLVQTNALHSIRSRIWLLWDPSKVTMQICGVR